MTQNRVENESCDALLLVGQGTRDEEGIAMCDTCAPVKAASP